MKNSTECGCGGHSKINENKETEDLGTLHISGNQSTKQILENFEFKRRPINNENGASFVDNLISESIKKYIIKK